MSAPRFPQHRLDEMIAAARSFSYPVPERRAEPAREFLAFRQPTIEEEFFARVLHCEPCGRMSPNWYPGVKCGGCLDEDRLHDPGDEDR